MNPSTIILLAACYLLLMAFIGLKLNTWESELKEYQKINWTICSPNFTRCVDNG